MGASAAIGRKRSAESAGVVHFCSLDDKIAIRLKRRALRLGRSAQAEPGEILLRELPLN
jgi:plasmid stability protein